MYDKNYLKKIQKLAQIPDQELKVEDLYHSTKAAVAFAPKSSNPILSSSINNSTLTTSTTSALGFAPSKPITNLKSREPVPNVPNVGLIQNSKSNISISESLSVEKSFSRSVSCNNLKTTNFDEDAFLIAADLETMDVSLLEFEE